MRYPFFPALFLVASFRLYAGDRGVVGDIQPLDPINGTPVDARSITVTYGCYCLVHGFEPCQSKIRLLGLASEDCPPTPGLPCGHTTALHTDILSGDFARQGGFLTDFRSPDVAKKEIDIGNGPQDPTEFPLVYTAGQATGSFMIETVATNLPRNHYFLTAQTVPSGDCESTLSCTLDFRITVRVGGLKEFQKPILISSVNGQPIPWLRCGKTPCADGGIVPFRVEDESRDGGFMISRGDGVRGV